jgi:hypothetical protein
MVEEHSKKEFCDALKEAVELGYLRFHPKDWYKPLLKRRLLKGPVTPPWHAGDG